MMTEELKYYTHGSEDSIDVDVYFAVDFPLNAEGSQISNPKICAELSALHGVNGNLIVIKNNNVTEVYKGTVDEVNNSLLATYHLHDQKYPQPITTRLQRDTVLKWLRAIRGVLSHCSRTQYRTIVKAALKSETLVDRVLALSQLDFEQIESFGKNPNTEVYKFITFQCAQAIALNFGIEIFTKREASEYLKDENARKFLFREAGGDLGYLTKLITSMYSFVPCEIDTEASSGSGWEFLISKFGKLSVKSEKYM